MAKALISSKRVTVQVLRRSLAAPAPGSASAQHDYSIVLTTRAEVKSRMGVSEWAQIDVDGTKATHTFTIRWTAVPFDARDRVRDARGQLWQILSIENVDLANREMRIHAASVGGENAPAAR